MGITSSRKLPPLQETVPEVSPREAAIWYRRHERIQNRERETDRQTGGGNLRQEEKEKKKSSQPLVISLCESPTGSISPFNWVVRRCHPHLQRLTQGSFPNTSLGWDPARNISSQESRVPVERGGCRVASTCWPRTILDPAVLQLGSCLQSWKTFGR